MRVLPILALAAGCASNSFSSDDSDAVMRQLMTVSYSTVRNAQPTGTPPPVISVDQAFACSGGGTSAVAGDFSGDVDATGSGSYSFDLMTTFSGCALPNGLVISGAPYLATNGKYTFQDRVLTTGAITYTGAFTANGDTCHIDFTIAMGNAASATGTICGNAIEYRGELRAH